MRPGDPGSAQNCLGCRRFVEPCNIFGNAPVKQRDVLRKIANMPAKLVRMPLIDRSTIETHHSAGRRPDADQRFGE